MWRSDTKFADSRATTAALFAAVVAVHVGLLAVADLTYEGWDESNETMAVTFSMTEVVEEQSAEEPVPVVIDEPAPRPEPVVVDEPVPTETNEQPSPVLAVPAATPATASAAPPSSRARGPAVPEPVEPNYHGAIVGRLEERKIYPAAARTRGIEGAVTVSFTVRPDGRVRRIRVESGDVHRYLQQAAAETVRKAAPFPLPGVPEADIEIIVTIAYRLEE